MTFLDIFALIVLLVLGATALGLLIIVGFLPGQIARQRSHPYAEAIGVCGWFGILTGGLLIPVAFVWAYLPWPSPAPGKEAEA